MSAASCWLGFLNLNYVRGGHFRFVSCPDTRVSDSIFWPNSQHLTLFLNLGEKPFKCKHCEMMFRHKSVLVYYLPPDFRFFFEIFFTKNVILACFSASRTRISYYFFDLSHIYQDVSTFTKIWKIDNFLHFSLYFIIYRLNTTYY